MHFDRVGPAQREQALLQLGCNVEQGYIFLPMKVRHFNEWLAGEAEPLHAT